VIFVFVFCLLVLSVSSVWADKEDEVDSDVGDLSVDDVDSIKERLYEEILDELESFDPTPQRCGRRCQACRIACLRSRLTPALRRQCAARCTRFGR